MVTSWGTTDHLLAYLADLFGQANYQNYQPLERPGQAVEAKRRAEARHRALLAQRERQRRREAERLRAGGG